MMRYQRSVTRGLQPFYLRRHFLLLHLSLPLPIFVTSKVATVKLMQIPDALVNCRVPSEAQLAPASLTMDHPTLPRLLVASYPFRLSSDLSKSSSSPDLIYLCRGLRGQPHVFYNGKQALVNRRSTVSFHTPMKLGKHDGGLHRCNSAPRLLQVEPGVHGRFDEAGDGEKGVTRCEIL